MRVAAARLSNTSKSTVGDGYTTFSSLFTHSLSVMKSIARYVHIDIYIYIYELISIVLELS